MVARRVCTICDVAGLALKDFRVLLTRRKGSNVSYCTRGAKCYYDVYMKFNNPGAEKFDPSRRDFLKKITLGALVTAIAPDVLAGTHGEQIEQNRAIKKSEIIEMENKGNLRDGFSRMKINIEFDDGKGEIIGAGSFFSLEDSQGGKAEFLSKEKHPELFQSGVDFNAIKKFYEAQEKKSHYLLRERTMRPAQR
jgi:hypothetical protein